jgi:hypothetical protein
MEEDRSKLGKSSWIMLGVAVLGFAIFGIVFAKLQGGHDEDVARCVTKCSKTIQCRNQSSDGGDLCEELCGLAPSKAETCMDTSSKSCGAFSRCVISEE